MIQGYRAGQLLGRDREIALLDELLGFPGGGGGSVVIVGEAGVGKSALLEEVGRRAQEGGIKVFKTTGARSETQLPYAALHRLLLTLLPAVERLAPEQRAAMLSAFGRGENDRPPTVFLVGLATLELLTEAAADIGALVSVDDCQWLDTATADVLQFVARRVESDPLVLLFSVREGWRAPIDIAGSKSVHLAPLDDASAAALLNITAPGLPASVSQRLLAEAMGNPLALAELPQMLSAEALSGSTQLPNRLPLTDRLEHAFANRLAELPDLTRKLLATASADEGATVAELLQAASIVAGETVSGVALDAAVASRLIALAPDGKVRFRHPLMRSATYQSAPASMRRQAHLAFGKVLERDTDRRAWHRADASTEPDEEVAAELEASAARAKRTGAIAQAAAALERAAALTPSQSTRARRLLETAELAIDLGQRGLATRLAREAQLLEVGPAELARSTWISESVSAGVMDQDRVQGLIEIATRAAATGGLDVAMKLLHLTAQKCWWSDPGPAARASVVQAAEELATPEQHLRFISLCSYALPMERAGAVIDALAAAARAGPNDADTAMLMGQAAAQVGASDLASELLEVAAAGLRHHARLGQLARVTMQQAFNAYPLANWAVLIPAAEEARRLAAETAQPLWGVGGLVMEAIANAVRGQPDVAEIKVAEAEAIALRSGTSFMLSWVQVARGFAALAKADYEVAYDQLNRIFDEQDPRRHWSISATVIGELADAGARSSHRSEALARLAELDRVAADTPAPLVQIGLRYARAILAKDDEAELLFQKALSPELKPWPFYRARASLAYGEWLRRQRRVAESRVSLREARDVFDALGFVPWSARAREELRAAGESSRKRQPDAWDQLSPQEMQIAQLAARGLSNREIGQNLFLSHKTVASHLYRLFPKLGITSRGQLRGALEDSKRPES